MEPRKFAKLLNEVADTVKPENILPKNAKRVSKKTQTLDMGSAVMKADGRKGANAYDHGYALHEPPLKKRKRDFSD